MSLCFLFPWLHIRFLFCFPMHTWPSCWSLFWRGISYHDLLPYCMPQCLFSRHRCKWAMLTNICFYLKNIIVYVMALTLDVNIYISFPALASSTSSGFLLWFNLLPFGLKGYLQILRLHCFFFLSFFESISLMVA